MFARQLLDKYDIRVVKTPVTVGGNAPSRNADNKSFAERNPCSTASCATSRTREDGSEAQEVVIRPERGV